MLLVDGEVGWLGRAVGQLGEDGGRVGDPDNHALATSNSEQTISRQKNGLTCPPKNMRQWKIRTVQVCYNQYL